MRIEYRVPPSTLFKGKPSRPHGSIALCGTYDKTLRAPKVVLHPGENHVDDAVWEQVLGHLITKALLANGVIVVLGQSDAPDADHEAQPYIAVEHEGLDEAPARQPPAKRRKGKA